MKYLFIFFILLSLFACADDPVSSGEQETTDTRTDLFPVNFFFIQQINEVESLKLPTVKYTDDGKRKDTSAISLEEFKTLANEFLEADITKPSLKHNYKEASFADQSIPSITLNYTSNNKNLPVQRVDVILDPNPVQDDKVKTVYIEKKEQRGEELILKKLYWKSRSNFQIITSRKTNNKHETISHVKVAWDNSEQ